MRRSTVLLSAAAVLVLSAGLVVGRLSSRIHPGHGGPENNHEWFAEQLGLTADQQQKMDAIWEDTKSQVDKMSDRRHSLDHDRDVAIRELLSPEQLAAYDGIFEAYHTKRAEFDKDRDKLFHDADMRSRALLSPEQQVKFDAMKKDMHSPDHHDHDRGAGVLPGRFMGPATQPAGQANGAVSS